MEKWEYKFEKGLFSENQQAIDLIAESVADGWEVIGYDVQSCNDGLVWFRFLLKRRIEDHEALSIEKKELQRCRNITALVDEINRLREQIRDFEASRG